ncbi:SDR family oxidoreductase [Micrococcales bacterium 31B]|nr:SDR family oxidoreductase [Micrococcales bacterium 31B]
MTTSTLTQTTLTTPSAAPESRAVYPDLVGKVVVVTGARGGIGGAAVAAFEAQGARVIGLDLAIPADGEGTSGVDYRVTDLLNTEAIAATVQSIVADHGRIDVWVNNAGFMDRKPALDLDLATWNKTFGINLTAAFFAAQAVGRVMAEQGGGSIVNLSSYAGLKARPNCADYAPAKAGIAHLTSCLAVEWGPLGIRVNAIAPGYIRTPMSAWMHEDPENFMTYVGKTPLRRLDEPSDIANMMVFLTSDAASYVTGQTLFVDGGAAHA